MTVAEDVVDVCLYRSFDMHMTSLRALHQSMKAINVEMQQFRVKCGAVEFDCIFSVQDNPYTLSLTSRGVKPGFFLFEVLPGYKIDIYLGDDYARLRNVLYVDDRSGQKLEPSVFFAELNSKIPHEASDTATLPPRESAAAHQDSDDRDKPFFNCWAKRGNGPSAKNKQKTRAILGKKALDYSIKINKSSIWSSAPTNRSWL